MKNDQLTRRQLIKAGSAGTLVAMAGWPLNSYSIGSSPQGKLALLGGEKVHAGSWPSWPVWNQSAEKDIADMYRTGRWFYGSGEHVADFEKIYAQLCGAKRCVTTASGTTALITALYVNGVDAGDEVIVSPFTFVATYNSVFLNKALPVFADTDPETILINPQTIEAKITDRTSAILPVHIYGLPCDMDAINTVAKKHNLKVVEDACQAWFAEYKGRKTGTMGDAGCFSFQNSKNLPAGEGGAITTNNDDIADRCASYRNVGRNYGNFKGQGSNSFRGSNFRMQQVQAIVLMSHLQRVKSDDEIRQRNAKYLDAKLKEIPGIVPYKMTDPSNISAYHLYAFRYIQEKFGNVPKEKFFKALNAEGIPAGGGYGQQNKDGLFEEAFASKGFKRLYSEKRLKQWRDENLHLPGNDQVCKEAVTFSQSVLLGSKQDMDDIINGITKVYENRTALLA
jgi:dTDP-4-amino-4,6-dideoxygalactose transaminase